MAKINIIGAGLAGCEAAWQLSSRGFEVEIFEMRNENRKTFAHRTQDCAELVCSNSLRSDEPTTAIGLLHQEMRLLNSLIMAAADANKIPAGSALAVDREGFSNFIKEKLLATKLVKITRQEISELPVSSAEPWIIATGPLTSDALSASILKLTNQQHLAFFDAIAPIIFTESIDFSKAWFQSRYDKGGKKDYINCPLNREQYLELIKDLKNSEKSDFKAWEKDIPNLIQDAKLFKNKNLVGEPEFISGEKTQHKTKFDRRSNLNDYTPYFDGCLPIEIMAERGEEVLRYGPMKPVGLTNPHFPKSPAGTPLKERPEKSYAVVQLRQDNQIGTIYNMVGFQTKMKYGEQQKVFRKIPGLENAEFARLGGIHRNTYINSPSILDRFLRCKAMPNLRFAGQITGVEGYVESAAVGLLAGIFTALEQKIGSETMNNNGFDANLTNETAIGALLHYITTPKSFQNEVQENKELQNFSAVFSPMNVNFGLFALLPEGIKKDDRKQAYKIRALEQIEKFRAFLPQ